MGTAAQGAQIKFAVDAELPFDASSKRFELILPESLAVTETMRETGAARGTRSKHHSRTVRETRRVGGTIQFHPGPAELDFFLPYILGGATSEGVTGLAETVPSFVAMIDRVTKVFTYSGLSVNVARLTGATGSPVTLELDLEGTDESVGSAGTFPDIDIPSEPQYIFPHASVSLGGTAYPMQRFQLTINNFLDVGRFMNSATRSQLPAQDRDIQLSLTLPYSTDEVSLYGIATAGVAGVLTLDDGNAEYAFAFGNLKAPKQTPTTPGKSEILLPLTLTAYDSDSDPALEVTKT